MTEKTPVTKSDFQDLIRVVADAFIKGMGQLKLTPDKAFLDYIPRDSTAVRMRKNWEQVGDSLRAASELVEQLDWCKSQWLTPTYIQKLHNIRTSIDEFEEERQKLLKMLGPALEDRGWVADEVTLNNRLRQHTEPLATIVQRLVELDRQAADHRDAPTESQ